MIIITMGSHIHDHLGVTTLSLLLRKTDIPPRPHLNFRHRLTHYEVYPRPRDRAPQLRPRSRFASDPVITNLKQQTLPVRT